MNLPRLLTEPCRSYGLYPAPDAVDIWAMLGRLDRRELETLAMAFAIRKPEAFEQKLLELWAIRQRSLEPAMSSSGQSEPGVAG